MRTVLGTSSFGVLLGAIVALGSGCGELEGDIEQPPVLATIRGQLSNPEGYAAGSNMRVAILWGGEDTLGGLRTSQDVPVQSVFPSQFKLDLRSLPPLESMRAPGEEDSDNDDPAPCASGWDPNSGEPQPAPGAPCDTDDPPLPGVGPEPQPAPPGPRTPSGRIEPQDTDDFRPVRPGDTFRIAVGTLVAYEDLNGNGKLDLLDDQATAGIDRIVGANEDLYVVYTEGTAVGEFAELGIPKGFSQVVVNRTCTREEAEPTDELPPTGAEPTIVDGGAQPVPMPTDFCSGAPEVKPIDALFTLPLTGSPKLSEFMCQGSSATMSVASAAPPPPPESPTTVSSPLATDPKLVCKADGTGYTYSPCESSQNLCGDRVSCIASTVTRPSPTPANWPCTSQ